MKHMLEDETYIDHMRISLTGRCNLKCVYCVSKSEGAHDTCDSLDASTILKILSSAVKTGLNRVRLTGGEPLLREDITYLIAGIRALGIEDISLSTNGVNLPALAPALREAGLRRIYISLDSLNPATYGMVSGGGTLSDAMKAIRAAGSSGFESVNINMIPIRGINDGEITDFVDLTRSTNCNVRFLELMPMTNHFIGHKNKITNIEVRRMVEAEYPAMEPVATQDDSRAFALPGASGTIEFISTACRQLCSSCSRLTITHRGGLKPCYFSIDEFPLQGACASEQYLEQMIMLAMSNKPTGRRAHGPEGQGSGPVNRDE